MKKIYCLLCFISSVFVSCLEDKGNDVYGELNDVTIGMFRDTIVEQFTRFQVSPEIMVKDQNFDPERYDYVWYIYTNYSNINVSDTLSHEKDLDVEITNIPGEYVLIFAMSDKETGVLYIPERRANVTVINSYSVGMLALSRVGDDANVTFINVVGSVIEDAYQKVNGEVAGKNPTGIRYITGMISSAEKMVVIMTDDEKGGTVVAPLDMSYVMDFKDMFYFLPKVVKPQAFGTHDITAFEYVNNDGILYRRGVMGEGGFPKYGVPVKGDYGKIAPFDFFYSLSANVAYFYDQVKERFVYMKTPLQGDVVITLPDVAGEFNPNNVGMQMLWGGLFGNPYAMNNGRAVMEDDAGERYMISFLVSSNEAKEPVFTPQKKIQLTYEGCREAHTFTTSQKANFLYYGYANKIACVSFSTGNLLDDYVIEGGNVDYIECDQVGNTNQMYVGISNGSGAKNSGSIVVLQMSTDGSLKEVNRHRNVCGQVVDFEYKK